MSEIAFGRVVTEVVYKNGKQAFTKQKQVETVKINSKQQLMDQILKQLDLLKDCDQVDFSIFTDKYSHEPIRMDITVRT